MKDNRGGARQGAGRKSPPVRTGNMSFRVSEEERKAILETKGKLSLIEWIMMKVKEDKNDNV